MEKDIRAAKMSNRFGLLLTGLLVIAGVSILSFGVREFTHAPTNSLPGTIHLLIKPLLYILYPASWLMVLNHLVLIFIGLFTLQRCRHYLPGVLIWAMPTIIPAAYFLMIIVSLS